MQPTPRRLRPAVTGGLGLALAAMLVLAAEASGTFGSPPGWLHALIAGAALAGLAATLTWARRLEHRDAVAPCAVLALAGVVALSANTLWWSARLDGLSRRPDERARAELESRAGVIQAQFAALMADISRPLEAARAPLARASGSQAEAFDLLDRVRQAASGKPGRGLSLYSRDGRVLAWDGGSYPLPAELFERLAEARIAYRAIAEQHLGRLYALMPVGEHVIVAEATLVARLDPRVRDVALPALAGDEISLLKLQDFREEGASFDAHFERHGDRYLAGGTGQRRLLFVALRSPDGSFLGFVRLMGVGATEMGLAVDRQHRTAAALLSSTCLLGIGLLLAAPVRARFAKSSSASGAIATIGGLIALWSARLVLSWFPLHAWIAGLDLFDSSLFASSGFFGLLRSPADLLLTSIALLVTAVAALRACGRLASRAWARSLPLAAAGHIGLAALAATGILGLPALATEVIGNASVDLLAVKPLSPEPATVTLQTSILLLVLSMFLLVEGCVLLAAAAGGLLARAAALVPRPEDGLSRWTLYAFLPGLLLAAALYDPLMVPPSRRAAESLFENVLLPEVTGQHEARLALLRATMGSIEEMPDMVDRILHRRDHTGSALALDIWLSTPLADSGYSASLLVQDPNGRVISRFGRNLPPAFDSRTPEGPVTGRAEPMVERASFLDVSKQILHAQLEVGYGPQSVGTVTAHILDEFDNLPFLTPETPYDRALAPRSRRLVAMPLASLGVGHTVYRSDGSVVFSNQHEVPKPPAGYTDLIVSPGAFRWEDEREGPPTRHIFFSDGHHLFALGFALPTPLERLARSVRISLLALALLAAALAPATVIQARGRVGTLWSAGLRALGRTHYRRLLATFAAATLLPLLGLSLLVSGYMRAEMERHVEERGLQGILSAGSLARTILETGEEDELEDDTLYWLSQLVGVDVILYEEGELAAASRRELFSSGLLPPRMEGSVYRRLALEERRYAMGRQSVREFEYRTIAAPVVTGDGRRRGMLSLPLEAQTAEAALGIQKIQDVTLITFAGMVLLMGAVGYLLALRVSRPIRSLRAAAARIATGDLDAVVPDRPRDETGELIASFNTMAQAIKEQRQDLERRRDYIEKILRNATIGVISMDRSGTIVTANPAAGTILGLPALAPGAGLASLLSTRPDLEPLAAILQEPLGGPRGNVELSLAGPPPDRTVRARAVTFLEGEGVILLLEDVTETVRSNRLAAWAEMARRIAHEIKNPLTPIQLSAEHIRRLRAENHPDFPELLEACLQTIMMEVAKLRRISAEFSTYSRIPTTRREPVPMTVLLEEVVRPYRIAMPPGTVLRLDIPPDLPRLEVDRSLLARALVNLIENALQAMPRGGTLSLGANASDGQMVIEVADTGIGMDAEALGRIFEPYFSTKDSGTGLGLAIARKAIEEHGGRIEVSSASGVGTTMRITLPAPRPEGSIRATRLAGRREDD